MLQTISSSTLFACSDLSREISLSSYNMLTALDIDSKSQLTIFFSQSIYLFCTFPFISHRNLIQDDHRRLYGAVCALIRLQPLRLLQLFGNKQLLYLLIIIREIPFLRTKILGANLKDSVTTPRTQKQSCDAAMRHSARNFTQL